MRDMSIDPSMTRQRRELDAVEFWRQFMTSFVFKDQGDTLEGTLLGYRAEGRGDDSVPWVKVQTKEGRRFELTAHQERLKALLVAAVPVIGDRIRITYLGENDRAAPGMSKTKLFDVEVKRPQGPSQPSEQSDVFGEVASENAPGAGGLSRNEAP